MFLSLLSVLVHFRVEFDRYNYRRTAAATNQTHRSDIRSTIQNTTSLPIKTADSQQSRYYAIFVHLGASSVEMKSSDDDKHCVGPHKPQIPTDSWK